MKHHYPRLIGSKRKLAMSSVGFYICFLVLSVSLLFATDTNCPAWQYYSNTSGHCVCGFDLDCGKQVEIGSVYCATNSIEKGGYYIGQCPFRPKFNIVDRMHSEMPSNVSQLDEVMCGPYNRRGLLCGECKEGYGRAVYSVDLKCADCSSIWSGYAISLYLFLQFVPITVIFIILVIFRVNITSGPLLGYVLFCQTSIAVMDHILHFVYDYVMSNTSHFLRVLMTLSTILSQFWSLQFLKAIIPPFCISEKLTSIHIVMLDFIPAVYPIILVVISCILMELHARNCALLQNLWKPFRAIISRINTAAVTGDAVIHAFASFIFLSNISVFCVVHKICNTVSVNKSPGDFHKIVFYIDPTVEWPSHKVLPYIWISIIFFVSVTLVPSVLLCLYPTRVYRYLSRFLSSRKRLAITAFAEALHSCFKDGLNGTRDYRALAGAPVFVILVFAVVFNVLIVNASQNVTTVLWLLLVCVVSHVKPCKSAVANISLTFHMALFGILFFTMYLWQYDLTVGTHTLELTFIAIFLSPHILVALWAGYTLGRCWTVWDSPMR